MRRQKRPSPVTQILLLQSMQLKCWLNLPLTWEQTRNLYVLWLQRQMHDICENWEIPISCSETKRKSQASSVIRLSHWSLDDVIWDNASWSDKERLRNEMSGLFLPTLDTFLMSLRSKFNSECTKVLKLISSVVQYGDNFCESVRQLASLPQLNADLCVAARVMLLQISRRIRQWKILKIGQHMSNLWTNV